VVDISFSYEPELRAAADEARLALRREANDLLAKLRAQIDHTLPVSTILREGDPATCILAAALETSADLIVMGTHARGRISRLLLGSTTEAVLRKAECPVLSVRHAPTTQPADSWTTEHIDTCLPL
jgi:nucleotide-binding universal stress UspA family protein